MQTASRGIARLAWLAAALLMPGATLAQRGGGPFAGLAGAWSGTGTVTLTSGASERIRCRSTYQVSPDGDQLSQSLRCASDSYRFELSSRAVSEGGRLSGSWTEATRGASGNLAGQATPGQISARVSGVGFNADLSLSTRGNRQTVTIRSQGTELSGVTLSLSRS